MDTHVMLLLILAVTVNPQPVSQGAGQDGGRPWLVDCPGCPQGTQAFIGIDGGQLGVYEQHSFGVTVDGGVLPVYEQRSLGVTVDGGVVPVYETRSLGVTVDGGTVVLAEDSRATVELIRVRQLLEQLVQIEIAENRILLQLKDPGRGLLPPPP